MERVEAVNRDPDFERPIDPRRQRRTRRNLLWPFAAIAVVALAAALAWRTFHTPARTPAAEPAAPPAASAAPAPGPAR